MQKKEPFNYEIVLKGSDHFGSWKAEGNFIMGRFQPFLWFLKVYDNRRIAGQTGKWYNLLYESEIVKNYSCSGIWFYEKYPDSNDYSGTWKIEEVLPPGSLERMI